MPRAKSKKPVGRPCVLSPAQVDEVVAWADANVGPKSKPISDIVRTIQTRLQVNGTTIRNIVKRRWRETREDFTDALRFCGDGVALQRFLAFFASARRTIHAYVYGFTSQVLVNALVAAKRRGIRVYVVVAGTAPAGIVIALRTADIQTKVISVRRRPHTQIFVVDKTVGLHGAMAWSEDGLRDIGGFMAFINGADAGELFKFVQKELAASERASERECKCCECKSDSGEGASESESDE